MSMIGALPMGVGHQEGVVWRAEQPPMVRIGQRRRRRVRLEGVAVCGLAGHPHRNPIRRRTFGVARAKAALAEFGNVIGHEMKAGARAGREAGRTFAIAPAG